MRTIFSTVFAALFAAGVSLSAIEGQVVATLSENIAEQWAGIPPERPPLVPTVASVVRKQPFKIEPIFYKVAVKEGKAAVRVRLTIHAPDGSVYFDSKDTLPGQEFPCTAPNAARLCASSLKIDFEPKDKAGEYEIIVRIMDLNDKSECVAKTKITLLDKAPALDIPPAELEGMLVRYYAAPRPECIMPLLRHMLDVKIPMLQKDKKRPFQPGPIASWFVFAFRRNPQLYPELAAMRSGAMDFRNSFLAQIALGVGGAAAETIPLPERKILQDGAGRTALDFDEVTLPWQIDALWSEFFVTGGRRPIERIVETIVCAEGPMSPEEYKKLKSPSMDDRLALIRHLNGVAAVWSLASNAKTHRLVSFYLEAMLQRGELKNDYTKNVVTKILAQAAANPAPAPAVKAP